MGESPNMHTAVLKHVLQKTMKSPRKSTKLQSCTSLFSNNYVTPPKHEKVVRALRKIAVLRSHKKYEQARDESNALKSQYKMVDIAAKTGESLQAVYRMLSDKKRRVQLKYTRKLTAEDKAAVVDIYNDNEVSYCLPDMKYAGLRFMSFTLREAYEVYCRKTERARIVAEKTFQALKPAHIRTVQQTPLRGARCEYCCNFGKTRETLIGLGIKGIPRNHASAIEKTWCKFRPDSDQRDEMDIRNVNLRNSLPKKDCVLRKCKDCGIMEYQKNIMIQNRVRIAQLKHVSWEQWGKVYYYNKKNKKQSRVDIIHYSGSIAKLLKLYFEQLKKMSMHQFCKIWQLRNFNLTLRNLQVGQVLFVNDFQQNLLLLTQDESSSAHWDHPQLTIHPTVVFYKCMNENCREIVKEDIIHITMDNKHDKYAVNTFIRATIDHLRKKGVLINEIIEYTDQSSGQYKSKFTFYYITKTEVDGKVVPSSRHFFGVKHGKGPSDRAGGTFKRTIRNAVKSGKMLLTSDAVEKFCQTKYNHQQSCRNRTDGKEQERFVSDAQRERYVSDAGEGDLDGRYVSDAGEGDRDDRYVSDAGEGDGDEESRPKKDNPHSLSKVFNHKRIMRPKRDLKLRGLEGSRDNLHVVRNTGVEGVVEYRMFDCACLGCVTNTGECTQSEYADSWTKFYLMPGKQINLNTINTEQWFKPIRNVVCNPVDQIQEFENEELDGGINCDEIEEDESDGEDSQRYEIEEEDESDGEDSQRYESEEEDESDEDEDSQRYESEEEDESDDGGLQRYETEPEDALRNESEHYETNDDDLLYLYTEDYVSSECSSDEEDFIYADELAMPLLEHDENVNFSWLRILEDMGSYNSFRSLADFVKRTELPPVQVRMKLKAGVNDVIDEAAKDYWPRDGPKNMIPIKTIGDGNCGPRAIAHLLLGDQNRHLEVRVRITFTAILEEESFLKHDILTRGCRRGTANKAASYAYYSGSITPEITVLTESSIRRVYQRDVIANSRSGNYMGIWQFHHAAEAFKRPLGSVYPRHTNKDLRSDMNRMILPLNPCHDNKQPAHFMWTPMRKKDEDDPTTANHNINHFVSVMVNVCFVKCCEITSKLGLF